MINGKDCLRLPLRSQSTFNMIINILRLPRSYPHEIAHRHHVPVRLSYIPGAEMDNIGACRQPLRFPTIMLTARRYRVPESRFLGELYDHGSLVQSENARHCRFLWL